MKLKETLFYSALAAVVAGDDGGIEGLVADKPTVANPCGEGSTYLNFQVITSAERDLMTECTTMSQTLWISKDYPGIFSLPKLRNVTGIYLGDPSDRKSGMITGQLTGASFPELIYASEIRSVNLENITSIEVPKLAYNDYKLELTGLPSLESYNGFESIRTTQYVIIERTGLSKINYNNMEYINRMEITNNPSLNNIELPVANISRLAVDCTSNPLPRFTGPANAVKLDVTLCGTPSGDPSTAFGIKTMVGETGEIAQYANADFLFDDNSFTSIGFPNLTRVDGLFGITNNDDLSDIVFPALTTVNGGLTIRNQQDLHTINKTMLPALVNVSYYLRFDGYLSDVSLPDTLVNAPVVISSTDYALNCSKYEEYAVSTITPGKTGIQVQCSAVGRPAAGSYSGGSSGGSSGSSSSSGSGGSGGPRLPARKIAGIVIGSGSSLVLILLIVFLWYRRDKKNLKKLLREEVMKAQAESASQVSPPQSVQPGTFATSQGRSNMSLEQPVPAASLEAKPHVETGSVPVVPMPVTTREEELDARQLALEERERELAAREAKVGHVS